MTSATAAIDLSSLVTFTPNPLAATHWEVAGGVGKWHGRVGTFIGVIAIPNARAHGIVLQFEDGQVGAFNPNDLFPVLTPK